MTEKNEIGKVYIWVKHVQFHFLSYQEKIPHLRAVC